MSNLLRWLSYGTGSRLNVLHSSGRRQTISLNTEVRVVWREDLEKGTDRKPRVVLYQLLLAAKEAVKQVSVTLGTLRSTVGTAVIH